MVGQDGRTRRAIVWAYGKAALVALVAALLLRAFVAQGYRVPSSSMLPTVLGGDYVLVSKLHYGLRMPLGDGWLFRFRAPQPGDVIVFTGPGGGATATPHAPDFVKRVVAVEGESVAVRDGQVRADGDVRVLVSDSAHRSVSGGVAVGVSFRPRRVPANELFVLGDNLEDSHDSREWGFVDRDSVGGKVLLVFWSWDSTEQTVRWERIGRVVH